MRGRGCTSEPGKADRGPVVQGHATSFSLTEECTQGEEGERCLQTQLEFVLGNKPQAEPSPGGVSSAHNSKW